MKYCYVLLFLLLFMPRANAQEKPFILGSTETIHSAILNEDRTLNFYVPENFDSKKSYPVIYLLDGSANEDFIHIVGIVQFLVMCEKMPQTIVVGIANVDRRRDFTFPTTIAKDRKDFPTTGSSAKFISFIADELEPFINKKFNVASKTIIGQSLGGLLATEILLEKPTLFNNYIIVSPSLWWDKESLLDKVPQSIEVKDDMATQVYISVGSEGKIMDTDAKNLYGIIKSLPGKNLTAYLTVLPDENHNTILHNAVYKAFLILNPKK